MEVKADKSFEMVLLIKRPNQNNPINFDTVDSTLLNAAKDFNLKNGHRKKITIMEIMKQTLLIRLDFYNLKCNEKIDPPRELSGYSRILYNEYGFHRYSNETGRLFTTRRIIELSSSLDQNNNLLADEDNLKDKDNMKLLCSSGFKDDTLETPHDKAVNSNENLVSDDQLKIAINFLINVQDIGSVEDVNRKVETLNQIKRLIYPYCAGKA
jgi:hypothetical protein